MSDVSRAALSRLRCRAADREYSGGADVLEELLVFVRGELVAIGEWKCYDGPCVGSGPRA